MAFQEKQLGQVRPSDTSAVSLYSPPASTTTIIRTIIVCNNTGSDATFRLFIDDDGSTYDQSTALAYDTTCPANTTYQLDGYYAMNDSDGNLAVASSTGNALTFTAFGAEIT